MVELGISVANTGEDSFQTYINITLPEDVAFVNVKMVSDPPVLCFLGNGTQYLLCDVGNPLRAAQAVGKTAKKHSTKRNNSVAFYRCNL